MFPFLLAGLNLLLAKILNFMGFYFVLIILLCELFQTMFTFRIYFPLLFFIYILKLLFSLGNDNFLGEVLILYLSLIFRVRLKNLLLLLFKHMLLHIRARLWFWFYSYLL